MSKFTTPMIENDDVKNIVSTIESGYIYNGVYHRPNKQVATILKLQANMGCRISDIVNLKVENIVFDGDTWKLDLTEQKTGKKRNFIVTTTTKDIIDKWCDEEGVYSGRLFKITNKNVWKFTRLCCDYLDLGHANCHSIRKNAGLRIFLASGKDIALTQQYYQHASPSTTAHYLERSNKQMDDAITKATLNFNN